MSEFYINLTLLLAVFFLILHGSLFGQTAPLSDDYPIMPLEEVKIGMHGTGFSNFKGIEVQPFQVEVLGVFYNQSGMGSTIMAKMAGANLEHTGVIAGMSGSPVFVDGKLIGAVFATFPFQKDPYGFIRPIEEMLSITERYQPAGTGPKDHPFFNPIDEQVSHLLAQKPKPDSLLITQLNDPSAPKHASGFDSGINDPRYPEKFSTPQPIRAPLFLTGFSDSTMEIFKAQFESMGFLPIQGGQYHSNFIPESISADEELYPGDAVGIQMVSGDVSIEAIGTVSYRKGKDVLLFGHYGFGRGQMEAPMTKAYIFDTIPSTQLSFKMGISLHEVGKIVSDYETAVAGILGEKADTVSVSLIASTPKQEKHLNFNVIKDPLFLPNVIYMVALESFKHLEAVNELSTVQIEFVTKVRNLSTNQVDTIRYKDFWTGDLAAKNMAQMMIGSLGFLPYLQYLLLNPIEPIDVEHIDLSISVRPDIYLLNILELRVLQEDIKPGDEVPIEVVMQNFKQETIIHQDTITIPSKMQSTRIVLGVSSAKVAELRLRQVNAGAYNPKTFTDYNDLIDFLNRDQAFNHLTIWLELPDIGIAFGNKQMPNLPSSRFFIYGTGLQTGMSLIMSRKSKSYASNYLINGGQMIPLTINLEGHAESKEESNG